MSVGDLLKSIPAVGGLFKGKEAGATSSEFAALAGLYAAVLPMDMAPWIKAVVLGAGTAAYMAVRAYLKGKEANS